MHPFALNQQETNLVTGGTYQVKSISGKTFDDRPTGVAPKYPIIEFLPIYTTMAIGEEGGEFPVEIYR